MAGPSFHGNDQLLACQTGFCQSLLEALTKPLKTDYVYTVFAWDFVHRQRFCQGLLAFARPAANGFRDR